MSERLESGHFYIVKNDSGTPLYCLYIKSDGNPLAFRYFPDDKRYELDREAHFQITEDFIREAQEISAPQTVWVGPKNAPVIFLMALFTEDVPNKSLDYIYSLADVRELLREHDEVLLEGIGIFERTSKGLSCFSNVYIEGLNALCQDFFQPEWLLTEFGLTSKGVQRFLKEGRFLSREDLESNHSYYGRNGIIIPIPSGSSYYSKVMFLPFFKFDEESGCYIHKIFSIMSPCNFLEYQEEMYVGIRVSWDESSGQLTGTFVLSQTFRSCQSISGDRVFWTWDELQEGIDDILDKDSQLEVPGLRRIFIAKNGRIHMQTHYWTIWEDVPEIRAKFLAQR